MLYSDGKAVNVTLTSTVAKGDPVVADGFFGIAMSAGSSGDDIALEIEQRVHEIEVGAGITAAKGDVLYIDEDGAVTNTDTDTPFMKVLVAKDSNNVVEGLLLPQA